MGRNTVGKGEIARYEQFLLFPQCFQKASKGFQKARYPGASKGVIVWEWVKRVLLPPIIPAQTKTELRPKRSCSMMYTLAKCSP